MLKVPKTELTERMEELLVNRPDAESPPLPMAPRINTPEGAPIHHARRLAVHVIAAEEIRQAYVPDDLKPKNEKK
jgi:hypothetical protein